ncbi:hypothetical protein F751_6866 [Auxenochlorella protothecoides]|uniref:Uncharacterized protein n=1 Tax=Auxenochlorella protothecoides TaxID=3075 RepID=A0A087SDU4_AUXPR|nr:hypothetical protein F751_6866 [Auxenochlorella protothecoides]KFM23898.1 hypothetical protein F751_6866 [Auxenochlorella protothecoides]
MLALESHRAMTSRKATCSSTFVSFPSTMLEGFIGAGSVRTSSLTATGLSVGVVRLGLLEVDSSPDAEVLVAVECLSAGQSACVADEDGNIGAGNQGRRNFGRNNQGDDNIVATFTHHIAASTTQ